jgi:penicillin-binding protein-related factor A (putative recombinase)
MRESIKGKRAIKTKAPREADYQRKLIKKLKAIPRSYFFVKEAGSIRGIADIIGCINGYFVALEVKRSLEESKKYSTRNALQNKFLADIQRVKGIAYKIYPENEEEILLILHDLNN